MPEKYYIDVSPVEPRFQPVSKLVSIEKDRCLGCIECAKRDCIYDVYAQRRFVPGELVDSAGAMCKSCMRCVQECRNSIIAKTLNPHYESLGDAYWTPQIISSLWQQASTGKIPVSGAGYDGPFSGAGFDSMWTDMSEIVRPTRDGIHGREYISTSVDIGRKLDHLSFAGNTMKDELPALFSMPMPVILDLPERARNRKRVTEAMRRAAAHTRIQAVMDDISVSGSHVIPRFRMGMEIVPDRSHRMISIVPENDETDMQSVLEVVRDLNTRFPNMVLCVEIRVEGDVVGKVVELACGGAGVIRLSADRTGNGYGGMKNSFIVDVVQAVHSALLEQGMRDCITLLAGGGVAMAEHVAKLIACGADAVVVDEPILIAMECRQCLDCVERGECVVDTDRIDVAWGAQRIVNLLGSWHSQLIEVMGAMGIREVRRLRGETGRVMFFEDLEKECFAPLFGRRKCVNQ